jgi:ADP-ribose diphosphatase
MNHSLNQKKLEKNSKISRKIIYQGKKVDLYIDEMKLNQKVKQFEIVIHPRVVAIIPISENNELLLIKQWRRATNEILIELPAGTIEKNETPLECAKRELQEETKYAANEIKEIGGFFSSPGFCNEYIHLFIASKLYKSPKEHDLDEGIDLFPISENAIIKMILEGEVKDSKTIAGFYYYLLWKNK